MARLTGLIGALLLAAVPIAAAAQTPAAPACASPEQAVDEGGFVRIGGIEQWITIKGERCGNPVILFLHGGPGNPLSPYADVIYGPWAGEFTLVQWDQRGAGRTYGRNPLSEEDALSVEQMTADGIEVARHLTQRLGADKIILMGGSWGSVLGVHMVKAEPELFHAYIGTSQVVSYRDNQAATYNRLLELTRAAEDEDVASRLEAIGSPPWSNPRNFGIVRRAVRKYEALSTDPFPAGWWEPAQSYATPEQLADYEAGEEYSFVQYVGMNGDGMFSGVELEALGTEFSTPVFIVQGAEDLLTTPEIARHYFESIRAPEKAFVLVPRAGHDPNQLLVDAQLDVLRRLVKPLVSVGR